MAIPKYSTVYKDNMREYLILELLHNMQAIYSTDIRGRWNWRGKIDMTQKRELRRPREMCHDL